jgi:hypothetical protein
LKKTKKMLGHLSVVVGASTYLYLICKVTQGTGEGLSFTTFALWSALAAIISITMLVQKANPAVPAVYCCGATTTAIVLFMKGRMAWTEFDTLILILVVLCVFLWLTSGPKAALIMSVTAGLVAGIPLLRIAWEAPLTSPVVANSGFLLANVLSFASAKDWTLKDRLYSGSNVILCLCLVVPWVIARYW